MNLVEQIRVGLGTFSGVDQSRTGHEQWSRLEQEWESLVEQIGVGLGTFSGVDQSMDKARLVE